MIWLRVNRVMVAVVIWSAPVWRLTSSRAAAMTEPASLTASRTRLGIATLVSRRDAASTASLPNTVIAAATASSAPYSSLVVISSWAMSVCRCASEAPYSAWAKPPNTGVPPTTVISLARRSPCEIC